MINETNNQLNFNEFCETIVERIRKRFDNSYTISTSDIRKNNNVVLKGVTIRKDNQNISPVLYLDDYYEQFVIEKCSLEYILSEIISAYNKAITGCDMPFDFEELSEDRIIFTLVNYELNQEFLCDVPHLQFKEFALIFKYLLKKDENGIATVTISNQLQEMKEISLSTMLEKALENTQRLLPCKFQSIDEVLREMLHTELGVPNVPYMYVLSNDIRQFGAASILYPGMIETICNQLDTESFIVIPSSIHEEIIIKEDSEMDFDFIETMIREVNKTSVRENEILGTKPFRITKNDMYSLEKLFTSNAF